MNLFIFFNVSFLCVCFEELFSQIILQQNISKCYAVYQKQTVFSVMNSKEMRNFADDTLLYL